MKFLSPLLLLAGLIPLQAESEKPNIVVFLVDDMGWSDLGCYGSELKTPNLDALAKNGLRFTQFYNGARCCSTRASLLTGLYARERFADRSGWRGAPKKYWDLYDRSKFALPEFRKAPEGAVDAAMRPNGELSQYKGTDNADNLSEEQQLELIHGYYAATSYMDAQVGKLLDALDRLGLSENTIIVFWGDHGWHLGDHGLWSKHTNFEEATRIPYIIAAPGLSKGAKTKSLAQSIDIYPTLLELTGLPRPESKPAIEGKSLVPVLKDPSAVVNDSVYHVYPRNGLIGRAIRTSTHRLVEWKKPGAVADTAEWELYDYESDPAETKNHVNDKGEVVAALKEKLATKPEAKPQIKASAEPEKPAAGNNKGGKQDRAKMFAGRDKDNDGKLTREEFLANQSDPQTAPARFTRFDKNNDGNLSKDEFISAGK